MLAEYEASVASGVLVRNVALARQLEASLGLASRFATELSIDPRDARPSASEAAFELPLPVLESVPVSEVLAFRRDAGDEFQAFRIALRTAVSEQLNAIPDGTAQDVADSVLDDVIRPALARINKRTNDAANLLLGRSAVSVVVGSAVAIVGFIAFAPLAVPGVVIGSGGLLATANDFLKSNRDISESDMYFLWKLDQRAAHH
jgi:hypothetical protein